MKKFLFLTFFCIFFPFYVLSQEIFLSLKKSKVNVRYGPSFESPVKYIYNKLHLPIKQIDEKENWRRIIDFKNNSGWIHWSQLKANSIIILKIRFYLKILLIFQNLLQKLKEVGY